MANADKGEIAFDKDHILVLDFDAFAEAEGALGVPIPAVLADPARFGFREARAIVWAGLQARHPGTSLKEASVLCQAKGLAATIRTIAAAAKLAFDDASAEGNGKTKVATSAT